MANVFDEMGTYWAEIANKNQTEQQIQFLKSLLKAKGYVLDLACGSGRHSIRLSAEGYDIVGFDASRKLLRIAKQNDKNINVVLGDMRFLPFKNGIFGAAISVDTSFGYLPNREDDKVSLVEARRVLSQDALFVIDVFNREHLRLKYKGKNNSTKKIDYPSFLLYQKRTLSDDGGWLCDSWTIRDKADRQVRSFKHKVRLYKMDELQSLLEDADFKINQVFGNYDREKFGANSKRLIFLSGAQ